MDKGTKLGRDGRRSGGRRQSQGRKDRVKQSWWREERRLRVTTYYYMYLITDC